MDRFKLLRKIFTVIKRNYRGGTSDATSKTLFNAIFSAFPKTIHVKKEPVGTDGQTDGHDLLQSCLPRSRVEKTNFSRVSNLAFEMTSQASTFSPPLKYKTIYFATVERFLAGSSRISNPFSHPSFFYFFVFFCSFFIFHAWAPCQTLSRSRCACAR